LRVLGINSIFHDPAAAVVVDGRIVAAAEEERYSRRKHGKEPVPFSAWELPVAAATWCLEHAGVTPDDLDAVACSYDPSLARPYDGDPMADWWEGLRTLYAERIPRFLATALEGLDEDRVTFVPHHQAHAASAYLASPFDTCAVMSVDGRGERTSYLAGRAEAGVLEVLAEQHLPHSLGLMYEAATDHLGFKRSSDEYKVMALASYGEPEFIDEMRRRITVTDDGRFEIDPIDWGALVKRREKGRGWEPEHANLASSVQVRLQEVLLDLARWLQHETGCTELAMAGGVALNCVANAHLYRHGPFQDIWVQPASGDAGTALGAASWVAARGGDRIEPMRSAALGSDWTDDQIRTALRAAAMPFEEPGDLTAEVASILADNGIVAWFQGRSEFGPRALGHRSLLADPRRAVNLERLNDVKGREQFRPVAPMVLLDRAADLFSGKFPSPYMLFTHEVRSEWRDRIPAVVHVDGTARIQTVDRSEEPLIARMLEEFDSLTGVPVVVNTSLNTAGRPIVDSPRDALECFGSGPIDALAIGPFLVRRSACFGGGMA
jgi:carbamoyltransferase